MVRIVLRSSYMVCFKTLALGDVVKLEELRLAKDGVCRRSRTQWCGACKAWLSIIVCVLLQFPANSASAVTPDQRNNKRDAACGPRCLLAIMRITGEGQPKYEVSDIYKIMGLQTLTPTSLQDMRLAAEQLGFATKAGKCDFDQLKQISGYMVVPVGGGSGSVEDPLHFILITRVYLHSLVVVDTQTLQPSLIGADEFKSAWNGYVLRVYEGPKMHPLQILDLSVNEADAVRAYAIRKDLGRVQSGRTVEHTFTVNVGRATKIAGKSCACVEAALAKDEMGKQTVQMHMRVDKAGPQKAEVIVEMDDHTFQRYGLAAYGENVLEAFPKSLVAVFAPNGGSVQSRIEIEYYTTKSGVIAFERMETDVAGLTAAKPTMERYEQGPDQHLVRIRIPLQYDVGPGPSKKRKVEGQIKVTVRTDEGLREVPLAFRGEIGTAAYEATPSQLLLIESRSHRLPMDCAVVKLRYRDVPHRIRISSSGSIPLVTSSRQDVEGNWLISVSVSAAEAAHRRNGEVEGQLTVYDENASNDGPVVVPWRVVTAD